MLSMSACVQSQFSVAAAVCVISSNFIRLVIVKITGQAIYTRSSQLVPRHVSFELASYLSYKGSWFWGLRYLQHWHILPLLGFLATEPRLLQTCGEISCLLKIMSKFENTLAVLSGWRLAVCIYCSFCVFCKLHASLCLGFSDSLTAVSCLGCVQGAKPVRKTCFSIRCSCFCSLCASL